MSRKIKGKHGGQRKKGLPSRALPKAIQKLKFGFPILALDPDKASKYLPTLADRLFVQRLTSYGLTVDQIASLIQAKFGVTLSTRTIETYFKHDLRSGKEMAIEECANRLFAKVRENNLSAIIFYLKTQGRWSSQVSLSDPDGKPMQMAPMVNVVFGKEDEDETGE